MSPEISKGLTKINSSMASEVPNTNEIYKQICDSWDDLVMHKIGYRIQSFNQYSN